MTSANGFDMWGKFVYHKIQAPERIVFVSSFADKEGNIIRAPFSQVWPLKIRNTWTFTEENGQTTLTLRDRPHQATAEEQKTFDEGHSSMQQGFGGTFDQLANYLAQLAK